MAKHTVTGNGSGQEEIEFVHSKRFHDVDHSGKALQWKSIRLHKRR